MLQRAALDVGAAETSVPLAVPQVPLVEAPTVALQKAAEEPSDPEHVQLYRPWHSALPMQFVATVPFVPTVPAQLMLGQPVVVTEDAVPVLQRAVLDVGTAETVVPSAVPHAPMVGVPAVASQEDAEEPSNPEHAQ